MEQWHVLYTKRHQETPVNRLLQEKGWETYLPGVVIERGYGRGRRLDPFFPQYVFVRVDLHSTKAQQIPYMTGVSKIVEFNGVPVVILDTLLEDIRSRHAVYLARTNGADELEKAPKEQSSAAAVPSHDLDRLFQPGLEGSQRSRLLLYLLAS